MSFEKLLILKRLFHNMPKAQNLKVTGRCFFEPNQKNVSIQALKEKILLYMANSSYTQTDAIHPFLNNSSLCMEFMVYNKSLEKVPIKYKIMQFFRIMSDFDCRQENYTRFLQTRVDTVPFNIKFLITPSQYRNKEGFEIEIIAKPAILYKINQLGHKFPTDEFKYTHIIDSNVEFLYEIMKAINTTITQLPSVVSDYTREIYKTPLLNEMRKYRFHRAEKILKEGLVKLNQGKVKESLDDIRSVLEIFTTEIINTYGHKKAHPQHKIKQNLQLLKDGGLLSEDIADFALQIIPKLYSLISDKISHKRNELSIRDGELIFNIIETYLRYLIAKIIQ